jgi:hypothetical protein
MVQFNAHFDGRTITPDELVEIPVNVPLRVTIETAHVGPGEGASASVASPQSEVGRPTHAEILKDFIGCLKDLPSDAAHNHDHYLYGAPKKS